MRLLPLKGTVFSFVEFGQHGCGNAFRIQDLPLSDLMIDSYPQLSNLKPFFSRYIFIHEEASAFHRVKLLKKCIYFYDCIHAVRGFVIELMNEIENATELILDHVSSIPKVDHVTPKVDQGSYFPLAWNLIILEQA